MRKLFLSSFLLFVAACSQPSAVPDKTKKEHPLSGIQIIYSANVSGEIEPCGCRGNPSGGINRRWNASKEHSDSHALVVDSGDLFYRAQSVPFLLRKQWDYQAEVLVDAYNALGVEYFAPGELDFASGMSQLLELRHRSKFQFLSANIYSNSQNELVFDPTAVTTKNGKKVGLIGLYDEDLELPEGYYAQPALEAARHYVALLRKDVEVVVALTHLGLEKDRLLAKEVAGIDVIVGSHSHSFLTLPERVGQTLILHSSYRGQHLGFFLDGLNTFHQLGDRYVSPSSSLNPMDLLLDKAKKNIAKLNAESDAEIFGERPKSVRKEATKEKTNLEPPKAPLRTFAQCAQCHVKQHEFVMQTAHSKAYLTLMKVGQNKNLDCLKCHTLGLGSPNGYQHVDKLVVDRAGRTIDVEEFARKLPQLSVSELRETQKAFLNVQCESCHSVAPAHPGPVAQGKVQTATCLACHSEERAPAWYKDGKIDDELLTKKVKSIACPP